MTIKSLQELFIHELSDTYSAEKQIARALPKMSRAATDEELIVAFREHVEETHNQIERIDQLVESTEDVKIRRRVKCHAMEGLVEEAQELIESVEAGPVRDAGLISAAQKIEHYEIASYGTLHALSLKLGYEEAAQLLAETLGEEKATDEKLTDIAEQQVNPDAADRPL